MNVACSEVGHVAKGTTGWTLAMGWQGAIVGLSFAAGTIVCTQSCLGLQHASCDTILPLATALCGT